MMRMALAWLVTLALTVPSQAAPLLTKTLVRPCDRGSARLKLQLGALPRGVEVVVTSETGALIGTAAPFALRSGQAAGTYAFALPTSLFRDGRITLRLSAKQYGVPERAPSPDEVKQVEVVCVPAPR